MFFLCTVLYRSTYVLYIVYIHPPLPPPNLLPLQRTGEDRSNEWNPLGITGMTSSTVSLMDTVLIPLPVHLLLGLQAAVREV